MRILLVNQYAGRVDLGMEYRPYYLAREWVRAGHSVTILGSSYSHLRKANPRPGQEWLEGIRFLWLWGPTYQGNGPRRALNMLLFGTLLLMLAPILALWLKPEVVIASSTHNLDGPGCRLLARLSGARLVYEVHDLWPLSPMELGRISSRHPFMALIQACEDGLCQSDRVVSILPYTRAHLESRGMPGDRFQHIANGIDLAEWHCPEPAPRELVELVLDMHNQGLFVVGYCGGHGPSNALDLLIAAASQLSPEKFRVVLVGQGIDKERLRGEAPSHVIFYPPVDKAQIPATLALFEALYLGFQDLPLYRYGISPNKLFEYMMAARPIVLALGPGTRIPSEQEALVERTTTLPQDITEGIQRLSLMSLEKRQQRGEACRAYALANHDYSVLARRFLEALSEESRSSRSSKEST